MRSILLFTCICLVFLSHAQEFPSKSSKWYYTNNGGEAAANTFLWLVKYEKDSVINGDAARVLKTYTNPAYGLLNEYIFKYSNDSVYGLNTHGKWGLLYVYSAAVGDTMEIMDFYSGTNQTYPYVVDSVIPVLYGSVYLKHFYTHSISIPQVDLTHRSYVERIGEEFFYPLIKGAMILEHAVIRCYVDSTVSIQINYTGTCDQGNPYSVNEISNEEFFSVFPSLTDGPVSIRVNSSNGFMVSVFNCLGKIILSRDVQNLKEVTVQMPDNIGNGVYFVRVESQSFVRTVKIILER